MHFKPKTLLISLAAAVTLYALLGFLILPAVALSLINKQFEERATLPAHLDDIKFNPFTLELTLTGLHIGELDEPEVAFERLYANVQIDSLWSRALHLRDVELAQAFTRVHFAKDGTLNLTKLFILPQPAEQTGEETDSAPFPVRIDRLALIANSLQFQDLRTSDPVEFGYDAVDMELTNLSVPHALVGLVLDVRVTHNAVEVMHKGQRVALHPRHGKDRFVTLTEHMPKSHQAHKNWSPGRFLNWGKDIGPSTQAVVQMQLRGRPHPEHGYRACLGLLNLSRRYSRDRLEQACARALAINSTSYQSITSILKQGLDQLPLPLSEDETEMTELPSHTNVRGSHYYH